jgi:predicted dehydrogenase
MRIPDVPRRDFLKQMTGTAAIMAALPHEPLGQPAVQGSGPMPAQQPAATPNPASPRLRFGVVGLNHNHIFSMVTAAIRGGGALVSVYAREPELVAGFQQRFPQVRLARTEAEVIDDPSLALVLSAAIPEERAPLGIRVMQRGKDYVADKPGITTLQQLAEVRRVQAATRRIYSIVYSERFENRATIKAGELVQAGAIGKVIQTIGLGPHRITPASRPAWFWDKPRYGGILCDIASHQADQFLYFTRSTRADVVASQVGNLHNAAHPDFEDFGDVMLRGDGGAGYIRVDWFTPDGLPTWGDGRLTILGTEGFIEIRKNVDIAGRPGESHLFLVDQKQTRYIDTAGVELPYGKLLIDDVLNRTETAMPQAHCLLATELMLRAQAQAQRVTFK